MQQYSPLHKEEMAWKSIFITSCLSHHHTPSYGSQCATAAVTRGFQKFQEVFYILEACCVEVLTSGIYLNIQYLPACMFYAPYVIYNSCREIIWSVTTPKWQLFNRYSTLNWRSGLETMPDRQSKLIIPVYVREEKFSLIFSSKPSKIKNADVLQILVLLPVVMSLAWIVQICLQ